MLQLPKKGKLRSAVVKRTGWDIGLTAAFIALVVIVNVVVFSLCALFSWYFWVDDDARYTISDATEPYFAAVNPEGRDVTVWFCMAPEKLKTNREYERVYDTVRQFTEKYDFLHVETMNIYYDYDLSAAWSAANGGAAVNEQSVVFTCGEGPDDPDYVCYVAAMETFYVFEERDNAARMEYNGEETVATLVNFVLHGDFDRPAALFTTGHAEASTTSLYSLLVSAGYTIGTVDLSAEDIMDRCSLLVISEPDYDFKDYDMEGTGIRFLSEIDKIEAFLDRGGTVMVMRKPGKELAMLDRFLARHGLANDVTATIEDHQSGVGTGGYLLLTDFAENETARALSSRVRAFNDARVVTGRASPIRDAGVAGATVTPLLKTSATAVCGEKDGPFTVAAQSSFAGKDGKTGNILLFSSGDVCAYDMMETNGYANEEMLYALLEAVEGRDVPIGCRLLILNAYPVENLTIAETNLYFVLLAVVLPLVVGAVGVVVCRRRKFR